MLNLSQAVLLYKNMKVEESVYLGKLFDAYGILLSERQQEICQLVLNDDLTLSEIALNLNITRQAVLDGLNKAEKKLKWFEENLGFLKQIARLEEENERLKKTNKEE